MYAQGFLSKHLLQSNTDRGAGCFRVVGLGRYLAEGGRGLEMLVGRVGITLKDKVIWQKIKPFVF